MISSISKHLFLIIALASVASMVVGTSLVQSQRVDAIKAKAAEVTSSSAASSVATSITTFQNDTHIIITITKPQGKPNEPLPPIVVIPPKTNETTPPVAPPANETKANETTPVTPPSNETTTTTPPLVPPVNENESQGGVTVNETQPGGQNITQVEPGGNVTVVPLPPQSNVTTAQNGTVVIIAPPDRNVTETPGNVVVVDPPAPPQKCTCQEQPPIGTNATTGNETKPVAPPINATSTSNQTVTHGNESTTTTKNETVTTTPTNETKAPAESNSTTVPSNISEGNSSGGLSTSAMKAAHPHNDHNNNNKK